MLSYRTHTSRSAVTSIQTYYYIMYCNIVVMTSYTSLDSVYYYFHPRAVHVYVLYACSIIYILYTQTFDDKFPQPETIAYFKFKRIRYYIILLCTPRNWRKILFWLKTYFCVCVRMQRGWEERERERVRENDSWFDVFQAILYYIYYIIWTKIKFVYVFFFII